MNPLNRFGPLHWPLSLQASIALILLLAGTRTAWAEPLSTAEFKDKFDRWKAEGKDPSALTLEVEGRVSLYSRDRFKLKGCEEVLFLSSADLPERSHKSLNVAAMGRLSRDPKSHAYTFRVSSVRVAPGDLERFFEKRRKLSDAAAEDWYALGRWATVRGEFYADDKLLSHADEAYRHGLEIERKSLAKNDPEGLLGLADKAKEYRLLTYSHELTHEAFYLLCEQSRKQPAAAIARLADRLVSALPGAAERLAFLPNELFADYKRRPMPTYAAADAATRRKLERGLYLELQSRLITAELKSDGSNGFEVAGRIDKIIPEQHALAEEFRDRALKARAADVEKLTRSQVIELFDEYRRRNQQRTAGDLLESWLTLRKQGLEPDDTEGLINLSDDYRQLLKRTDLADRLLIDGWSRNPKAADLIERLEKEGYRLVDGRWMSATEFANRPEGRLEKAIRSGLVETGMTAAQVRRSRGRPDSLSRSATAGQVTEQWTYKLADGTLLFVRFVKRAGQPEFTVAQVVDGKAR